MRISKKLLPIIIGAAVFLGVNALLNFLIIPYQYTRMKIHRIETENVQDLLLGSSHAGAAVDTAYLEELTGRSAFNAAAGGQYPRENYYLLRDACRSGAPERLLLEYDPTYWIVEDSFNRNARYQLSVMGLSKVKLDYFVDSCMGSDLRYVLMPWCLYRDSFGNIPKNIREKCSANYKNYGIETFVGTGETCEESGFLLIPDLIERNKTIPVYSYDGDTEKAVLTNRTYFEKTVEFCQSGGIELVVFTTPVPRSTKKANKAFYREAHEQMALLAEKWGFTYLDFIFPDEKLAPYVQNEPWKNFQFSDGEGHMRVTTARDFTKILSNVLS